MTINNFLLNATAVAAILIGGSAMGQADTSGKSDQGQAAPDKDKTKKAVPSVAAVGQKAPDFTLQDIDGKTHSLSKYKGKIVVLEWYNPDCPYSGKASAQSVHKRGTVKRTQEAAKSMDKDVVYRKGQKNAMIRI